MLSFQLAKFVHFIALAMLFGGTLTSYLISKRCSLEKGAEKGAFIASHLVAAPGLILLLISGFWQAQLFQWAQFKASYMHSKMLLVVLVIFLLGVDIRSQGVSRRALGTSNEKEIQVLMLKRKLRANFFAIISIAIIIFMMEVH